MEIHSDDDISKLLATFNRMTQQQSSMVSNVRTSSANLESASKGIASSVGEAASSTREVSVYVSEVSALMTEGDDAAKDAHRVLLSLAELVRTAQGKSQEVDSQLHDQHIHVRYAIHSQLIRFSRMIWRYSSLDRKSVV